MAEPTAPETGGTHSQEKNPKEPTTGNKTSRHPQKQLSRRAMWSGLVDKVRGALQEPEVPLAKQASNTMTRREMITRATIATGGAYLASNHLVNLVESLTSRPPESQTLKENEPTERQKIIDPTPEEQAQVEALIQYKPAEQYEFISDEKRVEIAKKYHLRLYNQSNVGDEYTDLYDRHFRYVNKEPHSFDQYLKVAKDLLLKKYGVELILGDDTREYANGGTPYKPGELESSEQAKHNIINMLESFFDQPVELFETIGLKKICLVKLGENIGGYVEPAKYNDTYFADITQGSNETFDHELYHLYDFKKCEDRVATDQGFNPSSSDYLGHETIRNVIRGEQAFKHPKGYISDEDFSVFMNRIIQDSYDAATDTYDPKYFEKYQSLVNQKAQQVAGVSTYSFADRLEDKAEAGVYLFNPNYYSSLFDERKPILRKKAIFLLARLFHDNSDIVKFFFETSNLIKSEELQYHFKRKPTDTNTS